MGDHYDTYRERDRLKGRLKLTPQSHEDAIQLLADGTAKEEAVQLLEGRITLEELEALLLTPLGQRRQNFLAQKKAHEEFEPSTPDDCLSFVKQRLVKMSKEADDEKNKIAALKALADVAMDERKNKPSSTVAQISSEDAKALESFGKKGE